MADQFIGSLAAANAGAPYCGAPPVPADLALRWNLDPVVLAALALFAASQVLGRRDRRGHEQPLALAGAAVLAVAFVSPLCALSSALFSARVVHHALLVAAAAPLLAFGLRLRVRVPLPAAVLGHAILFWAWHAPDLYAFALSNDAVYWAMQACLLGSALVFWAAVRRAEALPAAAALLFTLVQTGLLGAALTFAPGPLYAPHAATTAPWGLGALQDQQLAGLIMWAPMASLYLLAALVLVGRALSPGPAARWS